MGKTTRTCTFAGCSKPYLAKDLCGGHYSQHARGQELRPLRSNGRGVTLEQGFWMRVDKDAPSGCWEWTGATNSKGYGVLKPGGRAVRAHRLAWELANSPIPDGMFIDHRCANRKCVNPDHLRLVTNTQNAQHRTGANKGSASGIRGVVWDKNKNSWRAEATLNRRAYWGGNHSTLEEAESAVKALRSMLYTHDDHDEWISLTA